MVVVCITKSWFSFAKENKKGSYRRQVEVNIPLQKKMIYFLLV